MVFPGLGIIFDDFSFGRVVLYSVFMVFCSFPKTLVKTLAKNLANNLAKKIVVRKLAPKLIDVRCFSKVVPYMFILEHLKKVSPLFFSRFLILIPHSNGFKTACFKPF